MRRPVIAAVAVALACSAQAARAESDQAPRGKLGFRIGFGALPIDGHRVGTIGLGLGVEHQLTKTWRILGEYEWLWLSDEDATAMRDPNDSSGHRLHAGLRRTLAATTVRKVLRFYVDGELGGGIAAMSLPRTVGKEAAVLPHGFAGIRFGYGFLQKDNKGSRTWEPEFLLRAIGIPDGIGLSFGVGMAWD
ncbi:MAG: outer membrane beta-barrel protein [Deltaproteobacteria bacterium]|nr:outer membrane beta-barrel protein [Deltaproteobacteria bacterium]